MVRDAAATRARLLEAATQEFAAHGIAGARIDRIAALAGCNKQLIYAYFESKDGLFDAVFENMVIRALEEAPIDVADLPGYAGRLFDGYRRHPEVLRLATWQQLERATTQGIHPAALRSMSAKVDAIKSAQALGIISTRYPAEDLLQLILALATVGAPGAPEESPTRASEASLRVSLISAVAQLVS